MYEEIEYRGYNIKVYHDEDPTDPREWDNAGKMICFHNRYDLGDKHNLDIETAREYMKTDGMKGLRKGIIALPLYLYDHSGLTMNTGGFSCPWDSGQVGFIYISKRDCIKEWGWQYDEEKARDYLHCEVRTYDDYLTGRVFGYVIEDGEGEEMDSCWGFFGDPDDYLVPECKGIIDHIIEKREEENRQIAEAILMRSVDRILLNDPGKRVSVMERRV